MSTSTDSKRMSVTVVLQEQSGHVHHMVLAISARKDAFGLKDLASTGGRPVAGDEELSLKTLDRPLDSLANPMPFRIRRAAPYQLNGRPS